MLAILFSAVKSCLLRSLSFRFLNILLRLGRSTESNSEGLCLLHGMCSAQGISCCTCFALAAKPFASCLQSHPLFPAPRGALMGTGPHSNITMELLFGSFFACVQQNLLTGRGLRRRASFDCSQALVRSSAPSAAFQKAHSRLQGLIISSTHWAASRYSLSSEHL